MSSSLVTSSGSNVIFSNASGNNACGVQWQVSSSATIASGTTFVGNILALTSVFVQSGASLTGRALARNGEVTLNGNTISAAACGASAAPPPFPPPPVPTLPEIGAWALLLVLLGSGAYALRRRIPTEASK
jgi:drug/metabolite transporter (DMT)-like permease